MTEPVLPVEPVGRAIGATATLSFVGGFVDVASSRCLDCSRRTSPATSSCLASRWCMRTPD